MIPYASTAPRPRRSTFKPPTLPAIPFARPVSPESPQWEPLSPPRPIEPTFNYPAVARRISHGQAAPSNQSQHSQNSRGHQRSPSTIETLADAALSTSPQLPTVRPDASASVTPDSSRATKRARSDAGPNPHFYSSTRPSSSHHFPHAVQPLAYNTDRQRRQSTNTATVTSLEDAELLLNFAGRVASRPTPIEPLTVPAPFGPNAFPAHAHPPAPMPQPYPFTSAPTFPAPLPAPGTSQVVPTFPEHPSASLPSPQDTNEDDKSMETEKDMGQPPETVLTLPAAVDEPTAMGAPQQTHTPPEEERNASEQSTEPSIPVGQEPVELPSASLESQQASEAPAARPRRGWPKGKPRGPRNKNSALPKPRSSARRSRASTAKSVGDSTDSNAEEKRVRRKSDSDISFVRSDLSQLRSGESRASSVPPNLRFKVWQPRPKSTSGRKLSKEVTETVCASCAQTRESNHGELDQWISCNGCKLWFHFDCAGFKNERDVRDVDKFFCKACEARHGPTTFVRKSSRAHAAVDYAGLNQGILKTSDDNPEHHYIQPIKDGSFTFNPETFPRMRPELVTREFFETCASFSEPVVIPAELNPKFPSVQSSCFEEAADAVTPGFGTAQEEEEMTQIFEYETVPDDGQDRLDMVVPRDLTVRHVAELVGPDEPLEVIDVKTQGTEGKWNLRKWADYYEADGTKAVRNVISLEVSSTKLGKLLRRPKVVRDIDLQDSVWPDEETAKGNFPKVQFYCLMSVADSFTDFHIDFGGSSVYYHILRGKKTFFFIPPKPGHLKKYEDWNNSHEQNFTWLPDATQECYRVDLSAGDTMLIPSGWIHAVWTPENSLVIGGNFLTRMHYSTQLRIVDIEKAIKTPQKFRYPHFQKVMWYTVIKYLETDPLPADVAQGFFGGAKFLRERPIWQEFDQHGTRSDCAPGNAFYNARYYSQAELDGLHDIINFIFRTVMISLGRIEGVTEETRKKVVRSIPKSRGEPLELARTFALWVAWKRGNEDPPAWAHPDADLPDKESAAPKKLSARALKAMQRQEAFEAYKAAPERQSARQHAFRENSANAASPAPSLPSAPAVQTQTTPGSSNQHTSTPKTSVLGPKRVACDACRKRRIKCKHKDVVTTTTPLGPPSGLFQSVPSFDSGDTISSESQRRDSRDFFVNSVSPVKLPEQIVPPTENAGIAPVAQMTSADGHGPALVAGNALLADPNSKRGRSKACLDCRKSKRRCIHDENGKIDPVKAEQAPVPRGTVVSKKRRVSGEMESPTKKSKQPRLSQAGPVMPFSMESSYHPNMVSPPQYKQYPYGEANIPHWQQAPYMYPDPTTNGNVVINGGPYHQQSDMNAAYNAQSLEQLANEVLDSRFVNDGDYTVPQPNGDSTLHPALQHNPDHIQETSPLQSKTQAVNGSSAGISIRTEPVFANANHGQFPIASGGPVQPHSIVTSDQTSNALFMDGTVSTPSVEANTPVMEAESATAVDTADDAAFRPTSYAVGKDDSVQTMERAVSVPEKPAASLSAASTTGLANIPLYQPPPPLTKNQSPRVERRSFSITTEDRFSNTRRSLSKTPAPASAQTTETAELRTPGSKKRKRDSHSSTPNTAKSKKLDHNHREFSVIGEEDEQSLKLARELQDQDWGLRRRSRG